MLPPETKRKTEGDTSPASDAKRQRTEDKSPIAVRSENDVMCKTLKNGCESLFLLFYRGLVGSYLHCDYTANVNPSPC
jgi:hypothetical protein